MVAEDPKVARDAYGNLRRFRECVFISVAGVVSVIRQQLGQFQFAKTDQVEVKVFSLERATLREAFLRPNRH